ncbi:MAG: AMP-binding protein [Bacteroides sp.]|nr:AMP-binding protein [Bacteroides sp.]
MKHYFTRLQDMMAAHWDKPALCNYKGESFTFGELAEKIARFHLVFEAVGIRKGDRIALCAKNSARWGVSFLAINTYEAVVVPILADFLPESINSLVDHSESQVLFTDADMWKKLDINKMPLVRTVVSVTDFTILYAADKEVEEALAGLPGLFAAKYPDGFSIKDVDYPVDNAGELAIINYTSGTTSAPKGVMLRYECLTSNVEFGQVHIPSSAEDNMVSMLPMAHMYGMMFEFLYPLCGGTAIYYLGKTPTPALLLGAMKDIRPYLMITVPLVMEKIFKNSVQPVLKKPAVRAIAAIPGLNRMIFSKIRKKLMSALGGNVKMIIMGGAALNPDVEKWFKRIGLPFTVGYGMTEAAPLLAYEECGKFVPRSCGKAVDRAEVRIDSEDPQNVVGEIQARGTNIMSGYYKNAEATKAAFTEDGWMNTGDLGVIDAQGNIFIRGRSKNMILSSNGQNIYPEEIEAVINSQPYVIETVVVDRASKLVALVYLDKDKLAADGIEGESFDARMSEMLAAVNRDMPSYSKVTKVETVDAPFEKTPKMSIKRFLYK